MQTENKLQLSRCWLSTSVSVVPPQVREKSIRFHALLALSAGFWLAVHDFEINLTSLRIMFIIPHDGVKRIGE
jgi:hypothetical protein